MLVQPEVERERPPLVSIPPLQAHCSSTTSVRLNFRMARTSSAHNARNRRLARVKGVLNDFIVIIRLAGTSPAKLHV